MIRSIPLELANEGQNVRELFVDTKELGELLSPGTEPVKLGRLILAGPEQRPVSAAVKREGKQLLFLLCDIDEPGELTQLLELYIGVTEELRLVQQEPYEASYYEIQKVNNQLINYQRALSKANERLKMLLEEARQAKSTIEILERDSLTNLYTQEAFFDRAEALLKDNPDIAFDIIAVDIERFKMVNDSFGTDAGNKLLIELANTLLSIQIEGKSLFARAQADKFYAITVRNQAGYAELSQSICFLAENYPLPMRIQIKFGVYHIHDQSVGIPRMCDRALLAAASVKGAFDRCFAFYDDSVRRKMIREQKIINSMIEALEREEFKVYLQPKVEIGTGKPIGAEALVRWVHPEFGLISPGDFIPIFEKNGFIYAMDLFVWRKTCEMIAKWKELGWDYVPVSVNVSRTDIYHVELPAVLTDMVEHYHLQPGDLHLEITESAYVSDSRRLLEVARHLRQLGFVIEMDDFGNGYSSLNTLSELPIDVLKMDLIFLRQGKDVVRRQKVMQFVINLAGELDLQVIAEGAETTEHIKLLENMGCKCAQGYYYGKPMPEEEFGKYLCGKRPPER